MRALGIPFVRRMGCAHRYGADPPVSRQARVTIAYSRPITEIIARRFSCRSYLDRPIEGETRQQLEDVMSASHTGPFGTEARFELVAAREGDRQALKGLGTYGWIKGATAYVIGAVRGSEKNQEDFGYLMERIVLFATDLGLGTCWLGGTLTKSRFANAISLRDGESMPAVAATGYAAYTPRGMDALIRLGVGADKRRPWTRLFFEDRFGVPISRERAGVYATPLEMVRLGPSATNLQPWRILRQGKAWHFYLQRTRGYGRGTSRLIGGTDLQRIDVGIAMSHFELAASELGLKGEWRTHEPAIAKPNKLTEYIVSWVSTS